MRRPSGSWRHLTGGLNNFQLLPLDIYFLAPHEEYVCSHTLERTNTFTPYCIVSCHCRITLGEDQLEAKIKRKSVASKARNFYVLSFTLYLLCFIL